MHLLIAHNRGTKLISVEHVECPTIGQALKSWLISYPDLIGKHDRLVVFTDQGAMIYNVQATLPTLKDLKLEVSC